MVHNFGGFSFFGAYGSFGLCFLRVDRVFFGFTSFWGAPHLWGLLPFGSPLSSPCSGFVVFWARHLLDSLFLSSLNSPPFGFTVFWACCLWGSLSLGSPYLGSLLFGLTIFEVHCLLGSSSLGFAIFGFYFFGSPLFGFIIFRVRCLWARDFWASLCLGSSLNSPLFGFMVFWAPCLWGLLSLGSLNLPVFCFMLFGFVIFWICHFLELTIFSGSPFFLYSPLLRLYTLWLCSESSWSGIQVL